MEHIFNGVGYKISNYFKRKRKTGKCGKIHPTKLAKIDEYEGEYFGIWLYNVENII